MNSTESRFAEVEKAVQHVVSDQQRKVDLCGNLEWRAAGGLICLVCSSAQENAQQSEAMLRTLGMIQPVDKVVLMSMRPEFRKPFLRNCLLQEWGPERRDAMRAALDSLSSPLPVGW